jgi:hypothetical protein
MIHLHNPFYGVTVRTSGWIAAIWLAPLVLSAAAVLALSPTRPKRDDER